MSDLGELYQELILDHQRRPRNYRVLEAYNRHVQGTNPLCGDKLELYLLIDQDRIVDIGFVGSGCAISKASASMMTERLKGMTRQEAQSMFHLFHDILTAKPGESAAATEDPASLDEALETGLGKLAVFRGVREFPARVKCATLCWHALSAALSGDSQVVSTEQ